MSKNKGSSFERQVRDIICEATGIKLERTPGSGSWGRMQTKGDLIAPVKDKRRWPFFVECKKVEGWDMWNQLFGKEGPLFDWWVKAGVQAKEEGKTPLLIFAQNRRDILVMAKWEKNDCLPPESVVVVDEFVFIAPLKSWLKWAF